jgi:hypothetical protein
MANYITQQEVAVLLGLDNFSTATRPTSTQVDAIIADVTNEIDFTLASIGVTTQPSDTRLLGRLAIMCKYGVACQVAMSAYGNSTGVDGSQGDKFCERYKEMLDDITTNPTNYGAVTGDSAVYMSNQVADGTITETNQGDLYLPNEYEV